MNCGYNFRTLIAVSMIVIPALLVSLPALAADSTKERKPVFLEGGVNGKATIKPSVKVIQPGEPGLKSDRASLDGGYEARKARSRRLRKERRKKKKRLKRLRRKRLRMQMQPITTYDYRVRRGQVSTPEQRFNKYSSDYVDAIWLNSLTKGILKSPSYTYIPRFRKLDASANSKKRKKRRQRKLARKRGLKGYSIYSSKNKEFISPGYSVSFSTDEVRASTLGGSWYAKEDPPVPLIAKAGSLSDPIFVQPVILDPVGVNSEFRADPRTQGLVWSDWYKETARAIYNKWAKTEVGPGMVRVKVRVNKNRKLRAKIVSFKPAPYVTRDGIEETAFRKAAKQAIKSVSSFEIPKFPVPANSVVFDVEMKRMVNDSPGIEVALEDDADVENIMEMIDSLSPKEQKNVIDKLVK